MGKQWNKARNIGSLTEAREMCFVCFGTGYVIDMDKNGKPTKDDGKPCWNGCEPYDAT